MKVTPKFTNYTAQKAKFNAPLKDAFTTRNTPGSMGLTPRPTVEYPQLKTIKSGSNLLNMIGRTIKKILIGK